MLNPYFPPDLRLSEDLHHENHGAAVALLIREKRARNWLDLCRLFGFDPRTDHSGHYGLRRTLTGLINAGLISTKNGVAGPFSVTPTLEEVLDSLDISLVEAANLPRYAGFAARPLFGSRPEPTGSAHLFVLMPFAKRFEVTYAAIRTVANTMKLGITRADEMHSTQPVMDDIWRGICNCAVVVADCTGRNANVFYEIGIAHTIGRDVVLIAQESKDIPFDITHMRHIKYRPTLSGLEKLRRDLRKTLSDLRASGWPA